MWSTAILAFTLCSAEAFSGNSALRGSCNVQRCFAQRTISFCAMMSPRNNIRLNQYGDSIQGKELWCRFEFLGHLKSFQGSRLLHSQEVNMLTATAEVMSSPLCVKDRNNEEAQVLSKPQAGFEVDENMDVVGEGRDDSIPKHPIDENPRFASPHIYAALRSRMEAIASGAGRRYRVRTMKGFLNVHDSPDDPHRIDNLVSQVQEGDIVESVGPGVCGICPRTRQPVEWVEHDAGGWSVRLYGGFEWLEPIED